MQTNKKIDVKKLYKDFLKEPLSKTSHDLLQRHY